jgi:5-methylthioadenosine/S-adenosylhomocysteine deaminase
MLETKVQRALATEQPRFAGRSLVEYTADHNLLSERMNIIHSIWVTDDDLQLIANAGSVIVLNPISNLRLGSGVAPFRKMRDLGITTALGTDEAPCDDSVNLWGVVKMTGLIHNVTGLDFAQWPTAIEVLDSLWRGGAAAMLRSDDLGSVRVGQLADLTLLDLHSVVFTPLNDLRRQLVFCEAGSSVRLTMVGGRIVYDHGVLTTIDERALLAETRELFARKQPIIDASRRAADSFVPGYAAMIRRAAAADIESGRWPGVQVR